MRSKALEDYREGIILYYVLEEVWTHANFTGVNVSC